MKFIFWLLGFILSWAFATAVPLFAALAAALVLERVAVGYLVYDAILYSQWALITYLLWDKWFSPYARNLRKVAKLVDQAREDVG